MEKQRYMYHMNYQMHEKELCLLEMRALFAREVDSKVFFSDRGLDCSISPFMRNRLKLMYSAASLDEIVRLIEQDKLKSDCFLVRYMDLTSEERNRTEHKEICKLIGCAITGEVSFKSPDMIFGITLYGGSWYFGIFSSNDNTWRRHIDKPYSYSSSIGITTAKALVNIAANGDFGKKIIDPCCGVGTVLLEGAIAGYDIVGCEINDKIAENARKNLGHFDYSIRVETGDIKDIAEHYDVSIVDLPYGNRTIIHSETHLHIIRNAKRISDKLILISSSDLGDLIVDEGYELIDYCKVSKSMKHTFSRYIWVCV
ncbi:MULTISPECIES: TRM11 family methyltransferase [unclassified Fusibacter]|uniref:TRM11 family SAM-dependent methyltransferase n=1 Tax=unclassified Fusibacter TaxID=2624464 RepID=UPI001011E35F|nr:MULTISPECIES: SAM-dependent methyltransferase [unclassified Fusibacter]MCK8058983.1 SAM-dependent methyltransferase [Fusibacter sp. A2]NPE22394.1 SAM-dependent methyltransferase [Fusibacter sp. A1]RXV60501.1 SAM-dependent methyltransferase [Fusibacter sp. A1]